MSSSTRSVVTGLLEAAEWFFFTIATIAFLLGGGLLNAIGHIDRMAGEMIGFAVAGVSGVLGLLAEAGRERLAASEEVGKSL